MIRPVEQLRDQVGLLQSLEVSHLPEKNVDSFFFNIIHIILCTLNKI